MSRTQAERELNVKNDLCYTSETDRLLLNPWASNSLWLTELAHSGATSNIKDHEAVPAPSAQGEKQGRRVGTGCTARPEPLAASSVTPQQLDLYRRPRGGGCHAGGNQPEGSLLRCMAPNQLLHRLCGEATDIQNCSPSLPHPPLPRVSSLPCSSPQSFPPFTSYFA